MEYQKIKIPETNRYIYIRGDAYNKLLDKGHHEHDLLSLPRITA
jgi:hypothetical protein